MELAAPSASFTGLGISCNRDALFRNESKQENDFLPSTLFRCCFLSSLSQPRETVRMVRFLTQVTLSFDKEMRSAALLAIAAAIAAVGAAPNAARALRQRRNKHHPSSVSSAISVSSAASSGSSAQSSSAIQSSISVQPSVLSSAVPSVSLSSTPISSQVPSNSIQPLSPDAPSSSTATIASSSSIPISSGIPSPSFVPSSSIAPASSVFSIDTLISSSIPVSSGVPSFSVAPSSSACPQAPAPTNVIYNGDFERSDGNGWTVASSMDSIVYINSAATDSPRSGTQCASVGFTTNPYSDFGEPSVLSNLFTLKPNTRYDFSGW